MIAVNDLRTGNKYEEEGQLFIVVNYHHNKTGRGGAVIKLKVKNMDTGSITEKTYRPGDKVVPVQIEALDMQYLYKNGDLYVFMNTETFEQIDIGEDVMQEAKKYLIDNAMFSVHFHKEAAIGVYPPITMMLTVRETDPGVRGDTVSAPMKSATLETGLRIQVPLFIEPGQKIKVDTRSDEYIERA